MVEVIYLRRGEEMPDLPENEPWLIVWASDDGRFFGSGYGLYPSGAGVFYVSLPEDDLALDTAIAAAVSWAEQRDVVRVWVQPTPDG